MSDLRFLHRIHATALQDPHATAIVFHGEATRYGDLSNRVAAISAALVDAGVAPGARVGLHLRRSPDLVAALLSVLSVGATFVPLPVDSPAARNRLIAELAELDVLVVDRENSQHFAVPTCVALQSITSEDGRERPMVSVDDDALAYIMFTSGSTGRPKGVMVRRRNLAYFLDAVNQVIAFDDWGKMVAATTFGFDISLLELMLPLARGGTIILADDHESKSSEEVIRLAAGQGRTMVQATPTMWRMIVKAGWFRDGDVCVLCGGEALPFDLAHALHERARCVWNLYGPTETTIWSFAHRLEAGDFSDPARPVPIGRPLPGTGYAIETAQDDAFGELRITGPGVAAGYFRRPDLTVDQFPASTDNTAFEYRTGDTVTERADRLLVYVGRRDRQVKLNGFRIEPGEIEHVLDRLPGVAQSAVKAVDDGMGSTHLAAYIVPDGEKRAHAVSGWGSVWDATYLLQQGSATAEGTGYTSTFTGRPIEEDAVRTWAGATAERVLRTSPESVLDVGCGVGLLGERLLLEGVSRYHGCDLSEAAIEAARERLTGRVGPSSRWTLRCVAAHALRDETAETFDVVLLNSVVQYFPDRDYLFLVLQEAIAACRSGGKVIVGDIPATSTKTAIAAEMNPTASSSSLSERAREIGRRELWLDPSEIDAIAKELKRVAAVEIDLRLGDGDDEMTRFRYDVVLHLDADDRQRHNVEQVFEFGDIVAAEKRLSQWLSSAPGSFILRAIPNRRILRNGLPPVGERHLRIDDAVLAGADLRPDQMRAWARGEQRSICIRWSEPGDGTCIDISVSPQGSFSPLFEKRRQLADGAAPPLTCTTDPARDEELRKHLIDVLPRYMVPSQFAYLTRMPTTYNGKVDYSALPVLKVHSAAEPIKRRKTAAGSVLDQVKDVWSEILNVAEPPAQQPFLTVGGTSILVAELAHQLSILFSVRIPIVDLFVHTTITSQAAHIETLTGSFRVNRPNTPEIDFSANSARRQQALNAARLRRPSG